MKHLLSIIFSVILLYANSDVQAQKQITRTFSSDDALILREIGVVVVPKKDILVVDVVLGNNEKETIDIQKDDALLMANGKKLKSLKDLREQYENEQVGNEFKLGVKRGENLLIVKFTKKSDEELNKEGGKRMIIHMDAKDGEQVLPALGLRIMTKNNKAVISGTLPTISNNFKTFIPKENDVILSINGAKITTAEEFDKIYSELHEGDAVTIEFSRDEKISKETFSKPKPMGRMIIKK